MIHLRPWTVEEIPYGPIWLRRKTQPGVHRLVDNVDKDAGVLRWRTTCANAIELCFADMETLAKHYEWSNDRDMWASCGVLEVKD